MSWSIQYVGGTSVINQGANENHTQDTGEVLMASIATFKWGGGTS